jgi:hypothetical protein
VALQLSEVLSDPAGVADYLVCGAGLYGVTSATGRTGAGGTAVLEVAFRPLPVLADAGFPTEEVRISVPPDGENLAFPMGPFGRTFKHRNALPFASLCLEYADDDPALRWAWRDGFEEYVTRVYRHLLFEEQWRRTGTWPGEDAPHGRPRAPYPIQSLRLQREMLRWSRAS